MLEAGYAGGIAGLVGSFNEVIKIIVKKRDQKPDGKYRSRILDDPPIFVEEGCAKKKKAGKHKNPLPPAQITRQVSNDFRINQRKD